MKLSNLEKGKKAIVNSVDLDDSVRKRFASMGISSGTILRVCRKTFGSDSLHVKIECSSCLALSKREASCIEVTPVVGYCSDIEKRCKFENDEKCCEI